MKVKTMDRLFREGDLIKGKQNGYGITNEDMLLARVEKVYLGNLKMDIRIINHNWYPVKPYNEEKFTVDNDNNEFELVRGEEDFMMNDNIKINQDKKGISISCNTTYNPFEFGFGGFRYSYTDNYNNLPKKYVINKKKKTTVLLWKDGTKTIVKVSKNDKYDKKLGFLTAYFQKHSGLSRNKANKYLDELEEEK